MENVRDINHLGVLSIYRFVNTSKVVLGCYVDGVLKATDCLP